MVDSHILTRTGNLKLRYWVLGCLAWLIIMGTSLELSLPLLNQRFDTYFRHEINPLKLRTDEAQRFLDSPTFDPDLGWDIKPIAHNYIAGKVYLGQSYGDSFTEGTVGVADDTWQAHFERLTGQAILNLGVGGYGLDQAILKFEKYGSNYPTRIGILGLYHQTYRRALSYHSFYYFTNMEHFTFIFKPMFIKREGQFQLIRPPCKDVRCLIDVLSDPHNEVSQFVKQHDYWYQANIDKPVVGFPNTVKYTKIVPAVVRARRERQGLVNYFFVNHHSLELGQYLVKRFVEHSKKLGMIPLCLMLYSAPDLQLIKKGIRLDSFILNFLRTERISYVDAGQYVVDHYQKDDDFWSLYQSDGHLNERGNMMVAAALAEGLTTQGLLER